MKLNLLKTLPFAALALIACIKVDYVPLNDPPHPMVPRDPSTVQLFSTNRPDRQYVEVATIETQSGSSSQEDIMAKMREEAAQRGCDALILTGTNDATVVSGNAHFVSSSEMKGYRGTCIVYTGAPAGSAPPPVAAQAPAPAPMPTPAQ